MDSVRRMQILQFLDSKSKFDKFMLLACVIAEHSHCVCRKVGAVITLDTRIVSTGYNGAPSGLPHCDEEWPVLGCSKDSTGSCSLAIHAEMNALTFAWKNGVDVRDGRLFTTLSPCLPCAKLIYQAGIKRVYYLDKYGGHKELKHQEGIDFLLSTKTVDVIHYHGGTG